MREPSLTPRLQLLPTWLVLGALFVAPILMMFAVSFRERAPGGGLKPVENVKRYVTDGRFLRNYRDTIDADYARIYWRSTWIAVATTALCLLIGYPAAYYIAIVADPRRRNLLLALVAIPFWTSFLIRMGAWKLILGNEGVLNTILGSFGIGPFEMLYTPGAVLLGLVYVELPFMILPLYASLEKMDRTLLEAADDLGAGAAARFLRVTIPQTIPGIVAGVVLVFIPAAGQYVVSDMLGGGMKTPLVGNLIYDNFERYKPFKSAMAFELTAVVMLTLVFYGLYARRIREVA